MKGISLISGVLFTAFLITATGIVYWTAVPVIQKIQCAATLDKMETSFVNLDKVIQTVATEGVGSKRTVDFNIENGELYISGDENTIYWTHECEAQVFPPRTLLQALGNVIVGSNMDTEAYESYCQGYEAFVLENEHLEVCLRKMGSPGNKTYYNMSDVLVSVYNKDLNRTLPLEYLEITLDKNQASKTGNGYTKLERPGRHLPYGEVTAYMESDYGITYSIKFVLESGEDFFMVGVGQ